MDMNQAKQLFPSYYKSKELERILEVDEGKEFNVYRIFFLFMSSIYSLLVV